VSTFQAQGKISPIMDMNLTYETVGNMYAKAGYKFYDTGKYNVNIFGIRKDLTVDLFNDVIGIAYRDEKNNAQLKAFVGTTDPGTYWLKEKLGNMNGTFILMEGFYPKCWKIGKHKGEYEALVQAGPDVFRGWRDNNSDNKMDMVGKIYTDVQGLNCHTTSHLKGKADKVGAYSAACQVLKYTADHLQMMTICKKSAELYGPLFSYALFKQA
jgi:hypothetical protein